MVGDYHEMSSNAAADVTRAQIYQDSIRSITIATEYNDAPSKVNILLENLSLLQSTADVKMITISLSSRSYTFSQHSPGVF